MEVRYHCILLAEHKKREHEVATIQKRFVSMHYKTWWTQAKRTEQGAASGGTSIHLQRCFVAKRLDWPNLKAGCHLPTVPMNWTGTIIHGNINLVLVVAYFKDGIGMAGENLELLAEIVSWMLASGLPWVLVADWNCTPSQLMAANVMTHIKAAIIVPKDCAATCAMGSGRLLDFVMACPIMAPLLKVRTQLDIPVKPHIGISISIDLEPMEDKIRILSAPPLPSVTAIKKDKHRVSMELPPDPSVEARKRKLPKKGAWTAQVKLREESKTERQPSSGRGVGESALTNRPLPLTEGAGDPLSWVEAGKQAAGLSKWRRGWAAEGKGALKAISRGAVGDSLAVMLNLEEALRLGETYGDWICTAEVYLASRDPNLAGQWERVTGRACGPKFKMRSLKATVGCLGGSLDSTSSASQAARAWGNISGKMTLLAKLSSKDSDEARAQAKSVVGAIRKSVFAVSRIAEDAKDLQRIRRAKDWTAFVGKDNMSSAQNFGEWLAEANANLVACTEAQATESKKGFIRWQEEQLAELHGRGIYAWLKVAVWGSERRGHRAQRGGHHGQRGQL